LCQLLIIIIIIIIITCTGDNPSTTVRLVTSSGEIGYAEGRVQVLRSNTWRAICDNHWGVLDAQVICRMLCFKYVHIHLLINK